MTSFTDASIIIAILAKESDWQAHADSLDEADELLWSPLSRWESINGLRRQRAFDIEDARAIVDAFAAENDFIQVTIGEIESRIAVEAALRFGRGSGHPAKLNMGDCFAYACAKANNARLLYKGDDFAQTDLA